MIKPMKKTYNLLKISFLILVSFTNLWAGDDEYKPSNMIRRRWFKAAMRDIKGDIKEMGDCEYSNIWQNPNPNVIKDPKTKTKLQSILKKYEKSLIEYLTRPFSECGVDEDGRLELIGENSTAPEQEHPKLIKLEKKLYTWLRYLGCSNDYRFMKEDESESKNFYKNGIPTLPYYPMAKDDYTMVSPELQEGSIRRLLYCFELKLKEEALFQFFSLRPDEELPMKQDGVFSDCFSAPILITPNSFELSIAIGHAMVGLHVLDLQNKRVVLSIFIDSRKYGQNTIDHQNMFNNTCFYFSEDAIDMDQYTNLDQQETLLNELNEDWKRRLGKELISLNKSMCPMRQKGQEGVTHHESSRYSCRKFEAQWKSPYLSLNYGIQTKKEDGNCVIYSYNFIKALRKMVPDYYDEILRLSHLVSAQPENETYRKELSDLFLEKIKPYLPEYFDEQGSMKPYEQVKDHHLNQRWELSCQFIRDYFKKMKEEVSQQQKSNPPSQE